MDKRKRTVGLRQAQARLEDYEGDILFRPTQYPSKMVKDVLGGRWVEKESGWRLKPTSYVVENLTDWYGMDILIDAPDRIKDLVHHHRGFQGFKSHRELRKIAHAHPRWADLFPYQKDAVEFMACSPHGGCLLDLPPGRGKTATSVVASSVLKARKILVVAPMSLAPDWIDAFSDWYGSPINVQRVTSDDERTPGPEVTITNHEVLQQVIYRDEDGQVVKDPDTQPAMRKWIEDGPTKYDAKSGKVVPARERIVQAARSFA